MPPSLPSRPLMARATRLGAALLAAGALSACAVSSSSKQVSAGKGSIKEDSALKGQTFRVASKDFSESKILGFIAIDALTAAGAKTVDKTNIQGSANTRAALTSGNVDMYWDYTGTGWITYLKNTKPLKDPQAQFDATASQDLSKNKIKWLSPYAPANNTYALAVSQANADKLGLKTLSDLSALAKKDPSKVTMCIESEFSTRDDGLPGLLKTYAINIPRSNIKMVDTGIAYTEAGKGTTCLAGEVFITDGRIQAQKLLPLEDDKKFFPIYNPALTMKQETFQKYPSLEPLFAQISPKLTNEVLRGLNAQVDVDGKKPEDVAHDWMKQQGFIG